MIKRVNHGMCHTAKTPNFAMYTKHEHYTEIEDMSFHNFPTFLKETNSQKTTNTKQRRILLYKAKSFNTPIKQ